MSLYNFLISIAFRLLFFILIASNYLIYIIYNWLKLCKTEPVAYLIIALYHFFLILLLAAIYLTIYTDPGEVPFYWGFRHGDEDLKRKRYCLMCNVFKPDRCHHCSICNKCILNMDHHCPWINTCIGFYNRKYFIQMLCYIWIILIFSGIINFRFFYGSIKLLFYYQNFPSLSAIIYNAGVIFLYILDITATVVIYLFTKFHFKLILENKTTIETIDKKGDFESTYSHGTYNNFIQVFGSNKILWFIPVKIISGQPHGNGVNWEFDEELKDYDFTNEKDLKKELVNDKTISQSVSDLK